MITGTPAHVAPAPAAPSGVVWVVGDSINNTPDTNGYPKWWSYLRSQYPATTWRVAATPGVQITYILDAEIPHIPPNTQIVIADGGVNDIIRQGGISLPGVGALWFEMLQELHARAPQSVVIVETYVNLETGTEGASIAQINTFIRSLPQLFGFVRVADLDADMRFHQDPQRYMANAIHENQYGQILMAQDIGEQL